jgi:hypothetical protein
MAAKDSRSKDQEWEERTLCSDEACIGIIGPDGRCNECGKPYAGEPAGEAGAPEEELSLAPDTLLEEEAGSDDAGGDDAPDDADRDDEEDDDWEERILCSDESCIGVIGPDGRCKECGKPLDDDED